MRIFLLLLLSFPLLAKSTLYGDIDNDNKAETMELKNIGSTEMGTFYQLIVKDDNGKLLWKAGKSYDDSNRYSFFELHHGVSMPQILTDIDNDGYMELIAPEPQSDVSPTYYRKLKWIGKRFRVMSSNALMMDNHKRFTWKNTQDYQGTWVSGFVAVESHLVIANVISAIGDSYKSGTALLRFDAKGADVVNWMKPLKNGYNNHESRPKKAKPISTTKNDKVKLNLKLIINYSSNAKAKLENSGERLIASLMLNEYGDKYMTVEGVAMKEAKFSTKYDVNIHRMDMEKGHTYNPNKNYKVNINIYTAREVFKRNLVDCWSGTNEIDFDLKKIQGGTIEFTCKLIGE